jgi:hypothetical protein
MLRVDEETYQELKREYDRAVDDEVIVLNFHGDELLVSYAKYLLEYMRGLLDKPSWKGETR